MQYCLASRILRRLGAGRRGLALSGAALFAGLAASATEAPAMTRAVAVNCRIAAKIDATLGRQVCREFIAYLRESLPERDFQTGADALPRLDLTVTRADDRGIGFGLSWIGADGSARAGMPLSTSFYDRASDETLRRRFFKALLEQNPIPF